MVQLPAGNKRIEGDKNDTNREEEEEEEEENGTRPGSTEAFHSPGSGWARSHRLPP